jgi:hypothetical protein
MRITLLGLFGFSALVAVFVYAGYEFYRMADENEWLRRKPGVPR